MATEREKALDYAKRLKAAVEPFKPDDLSEILARNQSSRDRPDNSMDRETWERLHRLHEYLREARHILARLVPGGEG